MWFKYTLYILIVPGLYARCGSDGCFLRRQQELRSNVPSDVPSTQPSIVPSDMPSLSPSAVPSSMPSDMPSISPKEWIDPNESYTFPPTFEGDATFIISGEGDAELKSASDAPSDAPSIAPSSLPSDIPSSVPSYAPSA